MYEEVPNDPSVLVNTIIKALEKIRLRSDLSSDTLNYFVVEDPKFARFYLLPKIHKSLHNVPGRPVISNCGFYTESISSFLDYHLQPLAQKVKSYIKDTNHFLNKIKKLGSLPDGAILCTMDVVGLYPNIPHGEGLDSLRRYLETRDNKQISSDTLMELAEVVLKNNIFKFDEKTFKQKRLKEKMLEGFEKKPMIWWRYIDDIFFIWEHGEESLKVFIEQVNMFHSTIKFTAEYSKEEVNFLDVNIKLIDGELKTDLFVKPTDTYQFLDPTSCHPYHSKKGIPYSQALRLNRICSDNGTFDRRCNDLEKWLMEKGYNEKMIRKQILSAREYSRNDLLEKEKQQMPEKKLTFNITYYPAFQHVRRIMEELINS